jgi:hypothetical protein
MPIGPGNGQSRSAAARSSAPGTNEGPPAVSAAADRAKVAAAREAATAAAARAKESAERASEARARSAAAAEARLDDARVRALHGQLVEERRRLNQAGKVSVDTLAKSLRATESKLRRQYTGQNVDFHVVVRDGKAVVKPIIG